MSSSIPDLTALHCIRPHTLAASTKEIPNWTIEDDESPRNITPTHPHFDAITGVYKIPKDGIYLLLVRIIPIGGPTLRNARQTRKRVNYALHIEDPLADDQYLDIGSYNLGLMEHLRADTNITCIRMVGAPGGECIKITISCVQRKRKREETVLSKKEIKRKKRAASRAAGLARDASDDDVEDSSDSEWEHGFDSDSTSDELPTSARSVGRLAKRLKTVDAE